MSLGMEINGHAFFRDSHCMRVSERIAFCRAVGKQGLSEGRVRSPSQDNIVRVGMSWEGRTPQSQRLGTHSRKSRG